MNPTDLQAVVEYILDTEGEDMGENMDCLSPAAHINARGESGETEWNKNMEAYHNSEGLEQYRLFKWLTLNSVGHVYCNAARIEAATNK